MKKSYNFTNHISFYILKFIFFSFCLMVKYTYAESNEAITTVWAPYLEWNLKNPTFSENPFDVIAKVIFTHQESGKQHITEMFFKGGTLGLFVLPGQKLEHGVSAL